MPYVIKGKVKYVFDPPSFVQSISLNRPTNVSKKSPAQAKKFGVLYSKIDVFFFNLAVSSDF